MVQGTVDSDAQVLEVEGLGYEVERPPVHRRSDVLHVAVGRDDHGAYLGVDLGNLLEQGQAVHLGHIDVRDDHVNVLVLLEHLEGLDTIVGEFEGVFAGPDVAAHALPHQRLKIRLIVNDENLVWLLKSHAAGPASMALACPARAGARWHDQFPTAAIALLRES